MQDGIVFWLTGLSGAGKTTIGKLLYEKLKKEKSNVVFLDGDILREVFGSDLGYSLEDRRKSAMRNARLCKMLSDQDQVVVCCTISMFDEVRNWNRDNIKLYKEIYLQVSEDILRARNQKGLYSGESLADLVGFGVNMEEPKNPDMLIVNDGTFSINDIVGKILRSI